MRGNKTVTSQDFFSLWGQKSCVPFAVGVMKQASFSDTCILRHYVVNPQNLAAFFVSMPLV